MHRRLLGRALCALWMLSLAGTACAGSDTGEQLVATRCTVCHTLAPIETAHKSSQAWEQTVYRMIGRGARLNDAQARRVIEYLTQTHGPAQ